MKTATVRGVLRWHGGKQPLASRIVALMPPHRRYVEPYFGGGEVLLSKPFDGVDEVANDLDGRLNDFWSVLRDADRFAAFARLCQGTPFHERTWQEAEVAGTSADPVQRAWAFFVRCRLSYAGRGEDFTVPVRTRTRRGMNDAVSGWLSAVDGLPAVHERMKRVLWLCRPGLDVVDSEDAPGTLMYLDPPYPHGTRTVPDIYDHEMSDDDHRALIKRILRAKSMVMISGYSCPLYDEALKGWARHTFDVANHSASGPEKARRREILWCNF